MRYDGQRLPLIWEGDLNKSQWEDLGRRLKKAQVCLRSRSNRKYLGLDKTWGMQTTFVIRQHTFWLVFAVLITKVICIIHMIFSFYSSQFRLSPQGRQFRINFWKSSNWVKNTKKLIWKVFPYYSDVILVGVVSINLKLHFVTLCNTGGVKSSSQVLVTDVLHEKIGFFAQLPKNQF